MDADERARLRGEILADLAPLLRERLAADAWGRLLVSVERDAGGGFRVVAVDVDDIVGDEAALERAFDGPGRDEYLPLLASTAEALAALAGVDLDETGGGTLVRRPGGDFGWLPGLVRAPSAAFEARRDADVGELERRRAALPAAVGSARVRLDAAAERATFFDDRGRPAGEARARVVGSFSRRSYAWLWGWAHGDLPEPMRRAVKDVLDAVVDRSLWEVSTRQFGTDEPTAWALCALFCAESNAEAALRLAHADGAVFLALYDVRAGDLDADRDPGGAADPTLADVVAPAPAPGARAPGDAAPAPGGDVVARASRPEGPSP